MLDLLKFTAMLYAEKGDPFTKKNLQYLLKLKSKEVSKIPGVDHITDSASYLNQQICVGVQFLDTTLTSKSVSVISSTTYPSQHTYNYLILIPID